MLISMYYLEDSVSRLKNITATLERDGKRKGSNIDFSVIKGNAILALIDMKSAMDEISSLISRTQRLSQLTALDSVLNVMTSSIMNAETPEELKINIMSLTNVMEDFQQYDYYDLYDCDPSVRRSIAEYFLPGDYLSAVARVIKGVNRPLKVLDTYTKEYSMKSLEMFISSRYMELYAVDHSRTIPMDKRPMFKRIAFGHLKGATITNNAFDIVMLAPEVSLQKTGKAVIEKIERDALFKSVNYLRSDGLLIFALPITHLYKEICTFLAKNFVNVDIRLTENKQTLLFLGQKISGADRQLDKDVFIKLRTLILHKDEEQFSFSKEIPSFELPSAAEDVKMFRGSVLDDQELDVMYDESNCTKDFWKDQEVEKLSETSRHSLLPFNVGQLGLILTSGCLDGVINEKEGYKHAVKGRVVKKTDVTRSAEDTSSVDIMEIISNRVEINIFLADGTYKSLA